MIFILACGSPHLSGNSVEFLCLCFELNSGYLLDSFVAFIADNMMVIDMKDISKSEKSATYPRKGPGMLKLRNWRGEILNMCLVGDSGMAEVHNVGEKGSGAKEVQDLRTAFL